MSQRKLAIALILALSLVFALAGALPAVSHEDPCPDDFQETPTFGVLFTEYDKNSDGFVCVKMVEGEGNTHEDPDVVDNVVVKDDHEH
jgi:hypothetical protein